MKLKILSKLKTLLACADVIMLLILIEKKKKKQLGLYIIITIKHATREHIYIYNSQNSEI